MYVCMFYTILNNTRSYICALCYSIQYQCYVLCYNYLKLKRYLKKLFIKSKSTGINYSNGNFIKCRNNKMLL